jgi:hypothetical protein
MGRQRAVNRQPYSPTAACSSAKPPLGIGAGALVVASRVRFV